MNKRLFLCLISVKSILFALVDAPDIATVHFKVKDERENPVSNINIKVSTLATYMGRFVGSPRMQTFILHSDTNGEATCSYPCYDSHGHYMIFADDYYFESGDYSFKTKLSQGGTLTLDIIGKKEMDVFVKVWKKRVPIPMFYAESQRIRLPADRGTWGFDLKKADWVTPYGDGEYADFVFEYRLRKEGGIMSVDGAMVFSEHDGFYEDVMTESKTFHSTYSASLNANYANRRAFFESYQDDHEKKPILEAKRYLVMRTRTRVDTEGKVIRANYSQIYGPIRIKSNELFIPAIFFNPTPNDLNLEFDFKRNLSSKR